MYRTFKIEHNNRQIEPNNRLIRNVDLVFVEKETGQEKPRKGRINISKERKEKKERQVNGKIHVSDYSPK